VEDNYQDVMALEASVAKLHEMFVDFAELVEQQGELQDQIEFHVKSASGLIDSGNSDYEYILKDAIANTKTQCSILVIVLVVFGIIVGVVFALIS
jgi:t-SNARE complex subunit (syntaxin)